MVRRITEGILYAYLTFAVLFASVQWSIMLADGISPKELSQCLDPHDQSPTNSSR
jgi:hypothetical protein